MSYFDCFAGAEQEFTFEPPEFIAEHEIPITDTAETSLPDLASFSEASDSDSEGWSYRNEDVGVGAVVNPDATDWQDMVWVDWN